MKIYKGEKEMSGHSKWHNIQNTKAKADAARGQIFTKIGREIAVAVKAGGPDPNTNSKLYDVVQKAKQANMPNDNIMRSIKKASGELGGADYTEMLYEGYGTSGVAFVVECLTDNKNRTAGDVRHAFDKCGGALGTSGSVTFMFDRKGVVVFEKSVFSSVDEALDLALEFSMENPDAEIDDIAEDGDVYVLYCATGAYHKVLTDFDKFLQGKGKTVSIVESGIQYVPNNYIELNDEQRVKIERLADMLNDLDDVQNVYHNGI